MWAVWQLTRCIMKPWSEVAHDIRGEQCMKISVSTLSSRSAPILLIPMYYVVVRSSYMLTLSHLFAQYPFLVTPLVLEYTYSRLSSVLLRHRACARYSTPSSPLALWLRLQKRRTTGIMKWSHPPGGDTYFRDLRDVLVRNPSAMAFAPCDVTLHHQRLLWRDHIMVLVVHEPQKAGRSV